MDRKTCTQDITLVNMNVWFGLDCRGILKFGEYQPGNIKAARFQNLTNGLKNLQPDVIGIQEANPLPDYIRKLASTLGYDAVWKVTNSGIKIMGFGIPINFAAGNAILAKKAHGIKFLGSRRLSGMGLQTRYLSIHVRDLRDVIAARVDIRDQASILLVLKPKNSASPPIWKTGAVKSSPSVPSTTPMRHAAAIFPANWYWMWQSTPTAGNLKAHRFCKSYYAKI